MRVVLGISVIDCARTLGRTPATVRGWIRDGAPTLIPGEVGRGRGARVDVDQIRAWQARRRGMTIDDGGPAMLAQFAAAMMDSFRRDAGDGLPLYREIGVSQAKVAALFVDVYQRAHKRITGTNPTKLPPEIESLFSICVVSANSRNGEPT